MKKLLRKAVLFGMGVGSLTKEKIEDFVDDLQKEGKINEKEARKMVKDFLKEAKKNQKQMSNKFMKKVQEVFAKSPLATKEDIKSLERKLTSKKGSKKKKK